MTYPKKSLKRTFFCTNLLLASFVCNFSVFAGVAGRGVDPSVLEGNAAGPGAYTDALLHGPPPPRALRRRTQPQPHLFLPR